VKRLAWIGAVLCLLAAVVACQASGDEQGPAIPPRGSLELPPRDEAAALEGGKPSQPEACKHVWDVDKFGTHSYSVDEDGVPVVKLCTPIVCTKCGAVRHECLKELSRRRR